MRADFLADVLRGFKAPTSFKEVKVRCQKCQSVRAIPASQYREVVGNLALGYQCGCGSFVSMVRPNDDVTFISDSPQPVPVASTLQAKPPQTPVPVSPTSTNPATVSAGVKFVGVVISVGLALGMGLFIGAFLRTTGLPDGLKAIISILCMIGIGTSFYKDIWLRIFQK